MSTLEAVPTLDFSSHSNACIPTHNGHLNSAQQQHPAPRSRRALSTPLGHEGRTSSSAMSTAVAPIRTGPLGELHLLRISPWSLRVLLTLKHARAQVDVHEYKPMLSEFLIWVRLGFTSRKITAPVLFRPGQDCLMDSHAIARIVDGARAPGVPTLFPPEEDALLRRLVAHAETLGNFGRGEGMRYFVENPERAADLLLSPFVRRMPFVVSLLRPLLHRIQSKFADESREATEVRARAALVEVAQAVRNAKEVDGVRYVVGDRMSYADFALALSLPFVRIESSRMKGLPPHPIGDDFPELKEYGEAILKKHITKADVAFPPPKYNAKGQIVC